MAEGKILTVTQANELIKLLLEGNPLLKGLTVKGEISNLTVHRSGHLYFSLKDAGGVIKGVMFRAAAEKLRFALENGLKVLAKGRISVYGATGAYQLVCEELMPDGIGALQLAFEQSKKKLAAEGLFDASRKKPIPRFPRTVGVITSPTGAAIRDILNIAGRRFPFAKLLLYPALVQGEGAPTQLIAGVEAMGKVIRPDVLILGRGGGSAEDLWAFNDEGLVRAVAACPIPIISAVGHEIDFTLCDFAADLRAPTPSAAAEMAMPDTGEMLRRFGNVQSKLDQALSRCVKEARLRLTSLAQSRAMTAPGALVAERGRTVEQLSTSLGREMARYLEREGMYLGRQASLLDAVSPLKVLARGYAVVEKETGETVREAAGLAPGMKLRLHMHAGRAIATVDQVEGREGETDEGIQTDEGNRNEGNHERAAEL